MSVVPPARTRLLVPVVVCALVAVTALCAALVSAPGGRAAAPALRAGAGYHVPGGDFVGFYVTRTGAKVYGIDPGKRAPGSVTLHSVTRYPGMSQRTADELAYALSAWGDARGRVQAAVESQLVNTVVGHLTEVRRRARSLPREVTRTVTAHLRVVRRLHGPYTVQVRASRAASPGQSGSGAVHVVAASGAGVPQVRARLRSSGNAVLPSQVRTNTRGTASFRYTVTGPGPVRVDAVAAGLAPPRFAGSYPTPGRQRLVGPGRPVEATAQTGFEAGFPGFSHSYSCSTVCDGHPRVTLRACAARSAYRSRLIVGAGAVSSILEFPAATRSRCRSVALVLADRDRVSAAWTFRSPQGWTAPAPTAGTFVIDCPAVPTIAVDLRYDCSRGSLTATVTAPPGHAAVLVTAGAATQRVTARAGDTARFAVPVRCGSARTSGVRAYTMRAGVQRGDGTWTYGPAARVSTPTVRQP